MKQRVLCSPLMYLKHKIRPFITTIFSSSGIIINELAAGTVCSVIMVSDGDVIGSAADRAKGKQTNLSKYKLLYLKVVLPLVDHYGYTSGDARNVDDASWHLSTIIEIA